MLTIIINYLDMCEKSSFFNQGSWKRVGKQFRTSIFLLLKIAIVTNMGISLRFGHPFYWAWECVEIGDVFRYIIQQPDTDVVRSLLKQGSSRGGWKAISNEHILYAAN